VSISVLIIIIIFAVLIVAICIKIITRHENIKLLMQEEKLINAKLFKTVTPVAISPDGFIGIVDDEEITIIHIKNINEMRIYFDNMTIGDDAEVLLFNNIVSKIEPYLNKNTKDIYLHLYVKNNPLLEITLLYNNWDNDNNEAEYIPKNNQKVIRELLSEFEKVEKSIRNTKKCSSCNTEYTSSNEVCPNCGSSLYEEISNKQKKISGSESKGNANGFKPLSASVSGDTWVCKKCNEVNRSTSSSCKGCGEYR
jgi:RNA polymerase subunit RPABC4/transcription elongation factor Spt4